MNLNDAYAAFFRKPTVRVKNSSGEVIPPYAVLRIVSVADEDGELVYTVGKPDSTFYREYLVNGPLSIGAGENDEGLATTLSTPGFVLYDSTNTPALGESWGPADDSWELKKWRYGFTIKGNHTAVNGNDMVSAQQHAVNTFLFQANETITASGDTGPVSVYDGNQADIVGTDVTVTNVTSVGIVSGDKGIAHWLGGTWFGEPLECPS